MDKVASPLWASLVARSALQRQSSVCTYRAEKVGGSLLRLVCPTLLETDP